MKTVLYFIALAMLISGCEDEDAQTIQVSGQVVNFGSKQPISGAEVVLIDRMDGGGWMGESSDADRARIFTDAQGKFNLKLTEEAQAYLYVWKDKCSFENPSNTPLTFTEGIHENLVLKLKTEAPYLFNFNSTFKTDAGHKLDVSIKDENGITIGGYQFKGTGPFKINHVGIGDTNVTVELAYLKDGVTKYKTVGPYFLESFVDNTFTITY